MRLPGSDTELLGADRDGRARGERAGGGGRGRAGAAGGARGPALPGHRVRRRRDDERRSGCASRRRLAEVAAALRALHGCEPIAAGFDSFRLVENYAAATRERGGEVPAAYEGAHAAAARIEAALAPTGRQPRSLCHDDLLAANFIAVPGGVRLVDWEYAGMGDRYFDLGNFAVNNELDAGAGGGLPRRLPGARRRSPPSSPPCA